MTSPLRSLAASGTKLWLDSVDPDFVAANRKLGATGATSNPIIIADLLKTGRFDEQIANLLAEGKDHETIAWTVTDDLVKNAQDVFWPVYQETKGDDGYVSFELDPLLEDAACPLSHEEKVRTYIEQGIHWYGVATERGRPNRMIKVPATPAGLGALEDLAAAGVPLNVTLIFSMEQYENARDAVWRGAQKRKSLDTFKSVYSIFVSRLDVYTEKAAPQLSPAAQGMVGIVNAKRIWAANANFWKDKKTPLKQEMIFASTGTKKKEDAPWKYVEAFAGSDIETNPPATNDAVEKSGRTFTRQVDTLPPIEVLDEIDAEVDMKALERTLMSEGLSKFSEPQKALLKLIGLMQAQLTAN